MIHKFVLNCPLNYRWCCGRSDPASIIMINQHVVTAMCVCYLSINSFIWFFIYLLYNIINIQYMPNYWSCVLSITWTEKKKLKLRVSLIIHDSIFWTWSTKPQTVIKWGYSYPMFRIRPCKCTSRQRKISPRSEITISVTCN
jgi:hypothetical protein